MMFKALVFVLLVVASHVSAHGSGAGESACTDGLKPGHKAEAQSDPSPFTVIAPNTYTPGAATQITLKGDSAQFLGFLVVATDGAQPGNDNALYIGDFTPDSSTKKQCDGKGLTHTDPNPKSELVLTWNAPADITTPVKFFASFVKDQASTFWVAVPSAEVAAGAPTTAADSNSTAGSSTTTTTTAKPGSGSSVAGLSVLIGMLTAAVAIFA